MLRRLALPAVACLSALAAAPVATAAPAGPVATTAPAATPLPAPGTHPGHRLPGPWVRDRLTITVADSGSPAADGTHRLVCSPAGGTHASPQQACDRLDQLAAERRAPFAPVPARHDVHDAVRRSGHRAHHRGLAGTARRRDVPAYERVRGLPLGRPRTRPSAHRRLRPPQPFFHTTLVRAPPHPPMSGAPAFRLPAVTRHGPRGKMGQVVSKVQ